MKHIPIGELGATQLRRLSRFELQLKLILSELENRELKETTENQKNTVAQLQQDVFTDPMTRLHNRRWLEVKLKDLLLNEASFAFLVVDIDHFKSINDELSHLVGDKAIVNVSNEIANYFDFKALLASALVAKSFWSFWKTQHWKKPLNMRKRFASASTSLTGRRFSASAA